MRRLLLSAATLPLLLFSGAHAAQATAGSGTAGEEVSSRARELAARGVPALAGG